MATGVRRSLAEAFADYMLDCKVRRLSPRTAEFYQRTAGAFVAGDLNGNLPAALRAHLAGLTHLAPATQAMHARGIGVFLRWAEREGYLDKAPRVPAPKVPRGIKRTLSEAEVSKLLSAGHSLRDACILRLLLDSGLRREELVALDWQDVDMAQGILTVRNGKGGKGRQAVVSPATCAMLKRLRGDATGGPVFVNYRGDRLEAQGVRMVVMRAGSKAGLGTLGTHCLRRTCATRLLQIGWPLETVSLLLGHSQIGTTLRYYARVDTSNLLEAGKRCGWG